MITFNNTPSGIIGKSDVTNGTVIMIFFNRDDPTEPSGVDITGHFTFEEFLQIAKKVNEVEKNSWENRKCQYQ